MRDCTLHLFRLVFIGIFCLNGLLCHAQLYAANQCKINFVSEAPLEIIKASSNQLQGIVDLSKKTFAFKIFVKSFKGFNSPLQQEHFYENYMEVKSYPSAVFKGKILENISAERKNYRAKGSLEIHGVTVERVLDVTLDVSDDELTFSSDFQVPLVDHNIELPRIVYQKIAEIIDVQVEGKMQLRQ